MSGDELNLLREVYKHLKVAGFHQRTPEQKARLEALFKKLAGLLKDGAHEPTSPRAREGKLPPDSRLTTHDSRPPAPSAPVRALESAPTLILNVDGASRGNPGPAGGGGVLSAGDGDVLETFAVPLGRRTNNEAEYLALIEGLKLCARYAPRRLVVRSDSLLLVKQMRGEFRVKKNELVKLALEARRWFPCREIRFEHVPREKNAAADHLANLGVESSLET